jgi:enoyl-CoA hydratase
VSVTSARAGAVVTVTIDRPEARNALDRPTLAAVLQAFDAIDHDPEVRCAILTGAGDRAFIAGADIKAMADLDRDGGQAFSAAAQAAADKVEGARVPVIAAVNGFALGGGCELALACDFIYASRTAQFGQPEVGLGVLPGIGGTQRLPRRVGQAHARELIFTGRIIDAAEALRIGLANAVVEPGELMAKVNEVAAQIAAKAPLAVAAAKRAVRDGGDRPQADGLELERELFGRLFATQDQKEGMRAFIEKRPPRWTGH